jgi:hypothetical protein
MNRGKRQATTDGGQKAKRRKRGPTEPLPPAGPDPNRLSLVRAATAQPLTIREIALRDALSATLSAVVDTHVKWMLDLVVGYHGEDAPFTVPNGLPRPDNTFPPGQPVNRAFEPLEFKKPDDNWLETHAANQVIVSVVRRKFLRHKKDYGAPLGSPSRFVPEFDELHGLRLDSGDVLWLAWAPDADDKEDRDEKGRLRSSNVMPRDPCIGFTKHIYPGNEHERAILGQTIVGLAKHRFNRRMFKEHMFGHVDGRGVRLAPSGDDVFAYDDETFGSLFPERGVYPRLFPLCVCPPPPAEKVWCLACFYKSVRNMSTTSSSSSAEKKSNGSKSQTSTPSTKNKSNGSKSQTSSSNKSTGSNSKAAVPTAPASASPAAPRIKIPRVEMPAVVKPHTHSASISATRRTDARITAFTATLTTCDGAGKETKSPEGVTAQMTAVATNTESGFTRPRVESDTTRIEVTNVSFNGDLRMEVDVIFYDRTGTMLAHVSRAVTL